VARGEVFGMLGPNGAGKTTTIEVLEGLRPPDSGTVEVFGLDVCKHPDSIKQRIGVQLQSVSLYPRLTVTELRNLFGSFFQHSVPTKSSIDAGGPRRTGEGVFDEPLRRAAAAPVDRPGARQRSELIFLDEPTTGSTPRLAARCGTCQEAPGAGQVGDAGRPTTWKRPLSCATAWPSWTTAISWRWVPCRS